MTLAERLQALFPNATVDVQESEGELFLLVTEYGQSGVAVCKPGGEGPAIQTLASWHRSAKRI